jgi:adenylate cyclase
LKVMVVDDNHDAAELMADIVESLGYQTIKALDGIEALKIARLEIPDLILLDINMPGMSGFDVISALKDDHTTAEIPVIILTALSDVEHRVIGLGLGADDYLTKPYRPRELIARIETRLRAKNQTDSLREAQKRILQVFERFVAPSVVKKLLQDPTSVQLGGKMQEVTVFFADIEGFTTISERTLPEVLLIVLNRYHELIVETIQANSGTIDKFTGDGVMALYNTPLEIDRHPLHAVLTAYYIREALPIFHTQFEPDFRLTINFGIHTGMAVVGNVGTPQIMEYTAIGDTVNIAARLQELSENGQILISEDTYKQVEEHISARPIGPVHFKGRTGEVMTYEVLDLLQTPEKETAT